MRSKRQYSRVRKIVDSPRLGREATTSGCSSDDSLRAHCKDADQARSQPTSPGRLSGDLVRVAHPPELGTSGAYRPRDDHGPTDLRDLADRHIARATESNDMHKRYVALLRELRKFSLMILVVVLAFILAILAAAFMVGISPWATAGALTGGSALWLGGRVLVRRIRSKRAQ
jgi:hypothetical protein